jgi:hypothetical protein
MRLAAEYGKGLPRLKRLDGYRDGTSAVPVMATGEMREAYRQFVSRCRLNMAELISTSRTNRMRPIGFRTAAPGDKNGDAAAMRTWKRSNMKVGARDWFGYMADYGVGYLTVTGPQTPSAAAEPIMIPSSPWTTITSQYAARPWVSEAALQVGHDAIAGRDMMTLSRDGYMRIAVRAARASTFPTNGSRWNPGRDWEWLTDRIPLGYTDDTTVVQLAMKDGKAVYEDHTDHLDRINGTILDRCTIIAMQAFRQRAIEGDLPQFYPDDFADESLRGERIDYNSLFQAGPAALWMLPAGAKVWESTTTDITPVLTAEERDIRHLAAVTSTPLYVLSPDAAAGSAAGAGLAKEMNVSATEDMMDRAEGAIALAHSKAFRGMADPVRAEVGEIETIWATLDSSQWLQKAQAGQAAKDTMPRRMIWEKVYGLSPAEIEQAEQDASDESLLEAV